MLSQSIRWSLYDHYNCPIFSQQKIHKNPINCQFLSLLPPVFGPWSWCDHPGLPSWPGTDWLLHWKVWASPRSLGSGMRFPYEGFIGWLDVISCDLMWGYNMIYDIFWDFTSSKNRYKGLSEKTIQTKIRYASARCVWTWSLYLEDHPTDRNWWT